MTFEMCHLIITIIAIEHIKMLLIYVNKMSVDIGFRNVPYSIRLVIRGFKRNHLVLSEMCSLKASFSSLVLITKNQTLALFNEGISHSKC